MTVRCPLVSPTNTCSKPEESGLVGNDKNCELSHLFHPLTLMLPELRWRQVYSRFYPPAGSPPGVKFKPNPVQLLFELRLICRREMLLNQVFMCYLPGKTRAAVKFKASLDVYQRNWSSLKASQRRLKAIFDTKMKVFAVFHIQDVWVIFQSTFIVWVWMMESRNLWFSATSSGVTISGSPVSLS